MGFRADIQGLRALAVMFVFIFHLSSSSLPGGFIGVDVFFVISGYLISKIILLKLDHGRFSLPEFYISRIRRIVPAYYFLLIAVFISFLFVFVNTDLGMFRRAYFWTFNFLSNNFFVNLDDYFGATSNENPFLHTWTLAVEMQFYLILPIILVFLRNVKLLTLFLIVLTGGLLVFSTFEIVEGNKSSMYFSLPSRVPEFLIGVLLSLSKLEEKGIVKRYSFLLAVIGMTGLVCSAIFLNQTSPFPGATALLPCISTGLILMAPSSSINRTILSYKALVYIGEISYSIYLWHWPIMAFYRYYSSRYSFTYSETLAVIFLTIVTSLFSYYIIEKRFREQKARYFYISIATLAIVNVIMILTSVAVKNKISHIPLQYAAPQFGMNSHGKYFKKVGLFGVENGDGKRILLLGDSHALTLKPYLHGLGKRNGFSFRTITNDGIPAIPGLTEKEVANNFRWYIYNNLLQHITNEVDSANVIVVSFSDLSSKWIAPLQRMLSRLKEGQKVLILSDYPSIDKNPVRINRDFIRDRAKLQEYKLLYDVPDPSLLEIIAMNSNTRYVDLSKFDDFFDDAPFYNDTLMYYDESHLNHFGSVKYSEYSGSEFMKYLNWALEESQ